MILELLAKVTLILAGVVALSLVLRRASAASRHLVQVLGLAAVLGLPFGAALLPELEIPVLTAHATPTFYDEALPAVVAPARPAPETAVDADPCPCATAPLAAPYRSDGDDPDLLTAGGITGGSGGGGAPSIPWLPLVWVTGAAVVLGRLGLGWLRMTGIAIDATPLTDETTWEEIHACRRRLGVRRVPRVLVSSRVTVPALWGFLRPTLRLPHQIETWPVERLRTVVLHELAHLKRHDGAALLLGRIVTALLWFHPLAWWVERNARRNCEQACDDMVLACGERPSTYARHLLEIVRELPVNRVTPVGALSLLGPGVLEQRMRSILKPGVRRGLNTRTAVAALSLIAVSVISVSAVRLVARTADDAGHGTAGNAWMAGTHDADLGSSAAQAEPEILLAHDGDHTAHEAGRAAYKRAYDLHRAEKWEQAAAAFVEAAEAGYKVSTSLYNAACGFARMGQAAEALDLIDRAIDAGFDSRELIYEDSDLDPIRSDPAFRTLVEQMGEGRNRLGNDRFGAAVSAYEQLVDEDSQEGRAWYKVGSVLLSLRDYDRAADALERAAELQSSANPLYNLACMYSLQGDTRAALDYLERAVLAGFDSDERFENDSDLDAIRDSKRFGEIRELHDTLSLDRFRKTDWFDWNKGEYSSRRWGQAIEEYREFTAQRPEVGRAWFNLGWALHHSRRHDEAREAFERQAGTGYRSALARYNIACTYAMEDNTAAALDALEQAMELGGFSVGQLLHDDDLKSLHDEPRFERMLEAAMEAETDLDLFHDQQKQFEKWKDKSKGRISLR